MITVEKTSTDVRVTIPLGAVPPDRLDSFVDWLRLEEIAQKCQLTNQEADRIAEESKASWWAANRGRFIPREEQ